MAVAVGFRDHLVGYHEDHCPRGQAEADGIGDGEAAGHADTHQRADWLHQPGCRGDQHRTQRRQPGGAQRQRDGQALGNVLNGDRRGQRQADAQVAIGEAHTDGHAFWDVVQRNGEHKQPDPVQAFALGTTGASAFMLVWREVIQTEHEQHAKPQADHHRQRRSRAVTEQFTPRFQPRKDQGESARSEHHAGGKAKHAVLGAGRNVTQADRQKRADRRRYETGAAAQQRVANVARLAALQSVGGTRH